MVFQVIFRIKSSAKSRIFSSSETEELLTLIKNPKAWRGTAHDKKALGRDGLLL